MPRNLPFEKEQTIFQFHDSSSPSRGPTSPCTPTSTRGEISICFPALFDAHNGSQELNCTDPKSLLSYFHAELDVSRLNSIHKHLWIAGQERPTRALHHQALIGRRVVVTEKTDLHLLWIDTRLFVKPLPDFLLCHETWRLICTDQYLYAESAGLLLSYIWLVRTQSDLRIAHSDGLLPTHLSWEQWTSIATTALTRLDYHSFEGINPRYCYGELRLRRINWCWAFCSNTMSIRSLVRGYFYAYHDYETWFTRHTAWVTATTIYVALVLTAMQVGLGTERLQHNQAFQKASYGFTVLAIVAPLGILFVILLFMGFLIIWNLNYTLYLKRRKTHGQSLVWKSDALKRWTH